MKDSANARHTEQKALIRRNILRMLELQERINTQITSDWRKSNYAWCRASWIECAELMDHHGWKWWKKQAPDQNQIFLEIVDIWHFGLSDCLQHCQDKSLTADALYRSVYLVSLVPPAKPLLESVELFAKDCLQLNRFPTLSFAQLLAAAGLSFEQLTKLYLGKNTLNSFRQDHGYQDGSYQKVWDGQEDNEHLSGILDSIQDIETCPDIQDVVYKALKSSYPVPSE